MPSHQSFIIHKKQKLIFFHDARSERIREIEEFLCSPSIAILHRLCPEPTYVTLGGDGLFVSVAKRAFAERVPILGLNFGNVGYLLQSHELLEKQGIIMTSLSFPLIETHVLGENETYHGLAFNEVYVTRSGDASTITLSVDVGKGGSEFTGDGIMIATPAGSTGWSQSYGGVVIPLSEEHFSITAIGKIPTCQFPPHTVGELPMTITHHPRRETPIDILLDNRRILSMEKGPLEIRLTRTERGVEVLRLGEGG